MKTITVSLTIILSVLLLTVGCSAQTAKPAENAQDATESKAESATTEPPIIVLKGHTGNVGSVTFSPDGKTVATYYKDD
jgi:uncharacterized alpha/beta hydrolase family protein